MILTLVIMLFIILIVIWFWWYDKKRKEMLGKICQAIDNISKGSTSSILPVSTIHGDLNEISLRIIMMQHGLDARNKEIISNTQDSERRSYERMLAQNIRKYFYTETYQSLSDTTSQNMELAVRYKYLADVGGDFHDLFNLSPESVCFVAGSVTRPKKDQNNIQTALDVLLTMNMIRMCVSQNKPLNTSIFELNNLLLKQNKGRFSVNLFVGIIECNTGKVDFICVGSCAIYLVSKQNIMSFGMKHGSALALVENETYAYGNRVLDFGDMLLIYTAGAISSQNTQNERFGLQRMSKTIAEISSINPEMFLKKISENIAEFSEMQSEQIDDYTLMAIKYTKQNHQ
jgi:sigma-B regulation protein RsbU (phosphoserine phosphatase)